jgi:hypothetical protein
MATIQQRNASKRPGYAGKIFVISTWKGRLRVSAWPRKRGTPKDEYQKSITDRLKTVVAWLKTLHAREVIPMREAVEEHNKSVKGLKGAAAVRYRDIAHMNAEGRFLAFEMKDDGTTNPALVRPGTIWMSAAVAQDISDALDWTQPRKGALLVSHNGLWLPTRQCAIGAVFTSIDNNDAYLCCPEASMRGDMETPESTLTEEERRVQKALSVFGQEEGSIIVRGQDWWGALPPGPVGYVLAIGTDGLPDWYDPNNLPGS